MSPVFPSYSTASPSFAAPFWTPLTLPARTSGQTAATDHTQEPECFFSEEQDGPHDEFGLSEKFQRLKQQFRDHLDFLIAFSKKHGNPNAEKIEENFNIFFDHRFGENHYFDQRAKLVDSAGKRSLYEFCLMIGNESFDLEIRKAAIWNLSQGVTLCADGALANLASAACTLARAIGGVRGKLWELKDEAARTVLQQAARENFQHHSNYGGNEIHYVNTAWNTLADQFGLKQVPDGISMREAQEEAFLAQCAAQIKAVLTPDRLCLLMAEECQATFNSRITPSSGTWNPAIGRKFSDALEDIGNEFGWASEEALNSFVDLDENTYTYTLRTDPSLIALDVLRTISDLKLLQEENHPRNEGEWMEGDGMRASLFSYGELAWMARVPEREVFEQPVWASKDVIFEPITMPALLQWSAAGDDGHRIPPRSAIDQAIRVSSAAQLMETPAHWIKDAHSLKQLRQRLNTDQANHYLLANLSYFGRLSVDFDFDECVELLGAPMSEGVDIDSCNAVRTLIQQWPQDDVRIRQVLLIVLQCEAIPALHRAMQQQDANGAVNAWYRSLRDSGLLTLFPSNIVALLNPKSMNPPVLLEAMSHGRATEVGAFFGLIKNLLKDPTLRSQVAPKLAEILTEGVDGIYPLSTAIIQEHTDAIKAFYAGLKDLLTDADIASVLAPDLEGMLPDLLLGGRNGQGSGLFQAMRRGHTTAIEELHALVKDLLNVLSIAPAVELALPVILTPTDLYSKMPGLWHTMSNGHAAVARTFFDFLKDPAITPRISNELPYLLAAGGLHGHAGGLHQALKAGHHEVIKSFDAFLRHLLSDSDTAEKIRAAEPDLLRIMNLDGK